MDYTFPYCPRKGCRYHRTDLPEPYTDFISWGSYDTYAFGTVPRFRCNGCGHTFSTQTFAVDYFAKRVVDYWAVQKNLASTMSLSAIGRSLGLSSDSVSNRIFRAARQCLAAESRLSRSRRIDEDLAADGFESLLSLAIIFTQ